MSFRLRTLTVQKQKSFSIFVKFVKKIVFLKRVEFWLVPLLGERILLDLFYVVSSEKEESHWANPIIEA